MAFPVICGSKRNTLTATTSHVVALDTTPTTGDMLILLGSFSSDDAGTVTWPSDWTEIYNNKARPEIHVVTAYKVCNGEGSSITVGTTNSCTSTWAVVRVKAGTFVGAPEYASLAVGSISAPTPPALTPSWGQADTLRLLTLAVWGQSVQANGPGTAFYPLAHRQTPSGWTAFYYGFFTSATVTPSSVDLTGAGSYVWGHIALRGAGDSPSLYGVAANPQDWNGTIQVQSLSTNVPVTPPTGMLEGDLVVVFIVGRNGGAAGAPTVDTTGGQSWNNITGSYGTNIRQSLTWCRFNGTWTANPGFSISGASDISVAMLVFRPSVIGRFALWEVDVSATNTNSIGAAANITLTGHTTVGSRTVTVASFASPDDNRWDSDFVGWTPAGACNYRNSEGSDLSMTFACFLSTIAGTSTGSITKTQIELGNDNACGIVITFREIGPAENNSLTVKQAVKRAAFF